MNIPGTETYTRAVEAGNYDLNKGKLFGKYDSVRTFWEDRLTGISIRPFLSRLVADRARQNRGLRILDFGCGSGEGYKILTQIDRTDLDLGLQHARVLPEENLELYLGVDLSEAMVNKGRELFSDRTQARFVCGNLSSGLGAIKDDEKPFDLYYSSYGSLSHLKRSDLVKLLLDVCDHTEKESLVVLDLIGRYSIEWPGYWGAQLEEEKVRNYSMSYLYSEEDRANTKMERFPLRFWAGNEISVLANELQAGSGRRVEVLKTMDRSILVGRHTDTKEYNPNLPPVRQLANSLHEDYLRTDLDRLLLDSAMIPAHSEVTPFLKKLIRCWNILVEFTQKRLRRNISLVDMKGWSDFPSPLQFALMTMDRVIANVSWMTFGDPRANIIEPQLGYALRGLEHGLQSGMGCGHGLWTVLSIGKRTDNE